MRNESQIAEMVLNATSDDFESLEQIYLSVCMEFSSENYRPDDSNAFYWRKASDAPLLADIADTIKKLFEMGLLEIRMDLYEPATSIVDSSYVWRAWFRAKQRLN